MLEYGNDKLVVRYDPAICIHAKECVRGLPTVFNLSRKPWVDVSGASAAAVIEQVKRCPSGPLTYELLKKAQQTMCWSNRGRDTGVMSANGTKRACSERCSTAAFSSEADISGCYRAPVRDRALGQQSSKGEAANQGGCGSGI
jgi:uncharacterized Fe-S cluster protein YjdI